MCSRSYLKFELLPFLIKIMYHRLCTLILCNSCDFQYLMLGWPALALGPSLLFITCIYLLKGCSNSVPYLGSYGVEARQQHRQWEVGSSELSVHTHKSRLDSQTGDGCLVPESEKELTGHQPPEYAYWPECWLYKGKKENISRVHVNVNLYIASMLLR